MAHRYCLEQVVERDWLEQIVERDWLERVVECDWLEQVAECNLKDVDLEDVVLPSFCCEVSVRAPMLTEEF